MDKCWNGCVLEVYTEGTLFYRCGDSENGGVGAANFGELTGTEDGIVVEGGPSVAEGGELCVVFEAVVAETGAADGAALLFDSAVFVLVVGARAGDGDVGGVSFEEDKEIVVIDERAAIVDVDDFWCGKGRHVKRLVRVSVVASAPQFQQGVSPSHWAAASVIWRIQKKPPCLLHTTMTHHAAEYAV